MPSNHRVRVHIEYEFLYLAELRALLRDLEGAYNLLERSIEPETSRIRRADRLIVSAVETGNSLTLIFMGGAGLVALANILKKLADARESAWKSEKTKWEAKAARLDFEERERAVEQKKLVGKEPIVEASEMIERRLEIVERTTHITALSIDIDDTSHKILERPKPPSNDK